MPDNKNDNMSDKGNINLNKDENQDLQKVQNNEEVIATPASDNKMTPREYALLRREERKKDSNIGLAILGFFSVFVSGALLAFLISLIPYYYGGMFGSLFSITYLILPIVVLIYTIRKTREGGPKKSFYRGITIGILSCISLIVIIPLILLGSCFILAGTSFI